MRLDAKPQLAMYCAAGCGGCEIALLNTHEKILDVDANFKVAFWPIALDAKYKDVQALPDNALTLTLFDGAIRNDENERIAKLLRQKSQILVAFGACACQGGIPALGNLTSRHAILDAAFHTLTTDPADGNLPQVRWNAAEGELHLPAISPRVKALEHVVPVDYFMPGCPPEPHQIAGVVDLIIQAMQGKATLPPVGSTLGAGNSTVCDECQRGRAEKKIEKFVRLHNIQPDPSVCLLEQGIVCNGPATRSGCGAKCPAAGAPCFGCYGPANEVIDQGARMLSAIASSIHARAPGDIEQIFDGIPDPAGMFYRFSLAGSLLRASKAGWSE